MTDTVATELKSLNLLVVEDEPLLRRQLAANLERFGADVTAVESMAVARQGLNDEQFDFVLVDVNLPDGVGTDLLREKVFPAPTTVIGR
jgi:DNA-binding response OmpR family regulator